MIMEGTEFAERIPAIFVRLNALMTYRKLSVSSERFMSTLSVACMTSSIEAVCYSNAFSTASAAMSLLPVVDMIG